MWKLGFSNPGVATVPKPNLHVTSIQGCPLKSMSIVMLIKKPRCAMAISAGLDLSPFAGNDMFDEISNYKRTKPTINYPACSLKLTFSICPAYLLVVLVVL